MADRTSHTGFVNRSRLHDVTRHHLLIGVRTSDHGAPQDGGFDDFDDGGGGDDSWQTSGDGKPT